MVALRPVSRTTILTHLLWVVFLVHCDERYVLLPRGGVRKEEKKKKKKKKRWNSEVVGC